MKKLSKKQIEAIIIAIDLKMIFTGIKSKTAKLEFDYENQRVKFESSINNNVNKGFALSQFIDYSSYINHVGNSLIIDLKVKKLYINKPNDLNASYEHAFNVRIRKIANNKELVIRIF